MIYNLKEAKNHIELYAVQTSDNFGTQFIEYIHEAIDGTKTYAYDSNDEGNWVTPSIKRYNMLMKFTYSLTLKALSIKHARDAKS